MTLVLSLVLTAAATSTPSVKMCFASCARVTNPQESQPWWELIVNQQPAAFTWLGDAVYADKWSLERFTTGNKLIHEPEYVKHYNAQKEHPDYKRLRDTTPIFGTWDDHDFGTNDGDKTWPHKKAAHKAFLDFLDVPQDSPRRKLNGVYSSERIPYGDSHILLLLLDVRYNKDPWSARPHGDFLGEDQWAWLEKEVTNSDAPLILLGSGIQVVWNDWGHLGAEHWNRFPEAKHRLLNLLSGRRVVFLSGDVHMFEVRYIESWHALEVTTSGLSHSWADGALNRVVEIIGFKLPNYIAHLGMVLAQRFLPHRFQISNSLEKNFACLDMAPHGITVESWTIHGDPLFKRHFANEEIEFTYNQTYPVNLDNGDFEHVSDC
eukprot:GEMP01054739.1.p1 GENE.GEMP01054739.1~~GEMP01054739.1.p1  ORF type:complete len:405 (+),score=57.30 GEMP01054739.1:87-1217(+)